MLIKENSEFKNAIIKVLVIGHGPVQEVPKKEYKKSYYRLF